MSTMVFEDEEDFSVDPDTVKVPERPDHRQAIDVIAMAAIKLLGTDFDVFRDMNWYPPDGEGAIAPDIMVLPAESLVPPADAAPGERAKSYRQDQTGGPTPLAVVEIASRTDSWESMLHKLDRYGRLGTVVYVVALHPGAIQRFVPGESDMPGWQGRPIEELGGLRVSFEDSPLVVTMPDGLRANSENALLDHFVERATAAERRAKQAESRAEALAERLRQLGVDPD